MKEKLAIVGSGIAGMGAAYYLRHNFDITIFEKNSYVGGHTNTVDVKEGERTVAVDTGFIVFNQNTYPNLCALFDELGVKSEASDMSFSMYNQENGLQWSGKSWSSLFAQRKNLFSPQHWAFLKEVNRFNNEAPADLENLSFDTSLEEYMKSKGHSDYFIYNYIIPMGSAVWSTPVNKMMNFPARALVQFFKNHGFLGFYDGFSWRTVTGGSKNYMKRLQLNLAQAVRVDQPVVQIKRRENEVEIKTNKSNYTFDKVIIAAHADEALAMLEKPLIREEVYLKHFKYEKNIATLHYDKAAMPPSKRVWSSWNYKLRNHQNDIETATVYYMNRLQNLKCKEDYFVSINDYEEIDPAKVIRTITYYHPLFDTEAYKTQPLLHELNEEGPVYFCGSYFRWGFHEDALWSARTLADKILSKKHELMHI